MIVHEYFMGKYHHSFTKQYSYRWLTSVVKQVVLIIHQRVKICHFLENKLLTIKYWH
jgi:hypothetical protein